MLPSQLMSNNHFRLRGHYLPAIGEVLMRIRVLTRLSGRQRRLAQRFLLAELSARLFQCLALHKPKDMLPVLIILPIGVLPFGSLHWGKFEL